MATRTSTREYGFGPVLVVFGFLWTLGGVAKFAYASPIAALLTTIVGLVLMSFGFATTRKYLCSHCGNRIEKTSKICPACREELLP